MYEFIQNGLVAMSQGNYDLTETTAKDILKPIKNERKKSNYQCDVSWMAVLLTSLPVSYPYGTTFTLIVAYLLF